MVSGRRPSPRQCHASCTRHLSITVSPPTSPPHPLIHAPHPQQAPGPYSYDLWPCDAQEGADVAASAERGRAALLPEAQVRAPAAALPVSSRGPDG